MPPPGSFLFRCLQLPYVYPSSAGLSPWSLGSGMRAAPWPGWQGWRPGEELWYVSGFGVRL